MFIAHALNYVHGGCQSHVSYNIKTNQYVKYKCITYGSGAGKTFLDEAAFPTEDELSDFEFGQAYTNWLTLIKQYQTL